MADLNTNVIQDINIEEDIFLDGIDINLFVNIDIFVVEEFSVYPLYFSLAVFDIISRVEIISFFTDLSLTNVFEEILLEEVFSPYIEIELSVVDNAESSESYVYAPETLYLSRHEGIALLLDFVTFGTTPKYIDINDSITIEEFVFTLDLSEVDMHVEEINLFENVNIQLIFPFNQLLRSYPFVQRTLTGVIGQQFEDGVVQERDTWGRKKTRFDIYSPPLTAVEASQFQSFFNYYYDKTFDFVNPVDGKTYVLRLLEKEFRLERRHFNTFYCSMAVEEVL